MRNPQAFQRVNQVLKSNGNPMDLLKQITQGYSPEQMNGLFERAKQFGVPDNIVQQARDGINIQNVDIKK